MKALITGASSGIGRDMAKYLSKLGYDLVIVARRKELLEDLRNELKANVIVETYDISQKESCFELFEKHKDIDFLINNAGFGIFGKFRESELEKELNLIDTNIKGLHILTKLYLKEMIKKDKGQILNVGSIAGFMPGPLMSSYYASKAYVITLSRSINKELKKSNSKVRVSVLCPGPVKTEFNTVANVHFRTKSLSSNYVAKYGIDKALKGKKIIIPGIQMKLAKFCTRIAPNSLVEEISYNIQRSKS